MRRSGLILDSCVLSSSGPAGSPHAISVFLPNGVLPVNRGTIRNFFKKISTELSLVIGFKQENSMSSGEDGQAVKLELWVVEEGHAAFALRVILAAFNED
jgi:hypothetical protein